MRKTNNSKDRSRSLRDDKQKDNGKDNDKNNDKDNGKGNGKNNDKDNGSGKSWLGEVIHFTHAALSPQRAKALVGDPDGLRHGWGTRAFVTELKEGHPAT